MLLQPAAKAVFTRQGCHPTTADDFIGPFISSIVPASLRASRDHGAIRPHPPSPIFLLCYQREEEEQEKEEEKEKEEKHESEWIRIDATQSSSVSQ